MILVGYRVEHADLGKGRVVYVRRIQGLDTTALVKWDNGGASEHNIYFLKKL